MEILKFQRPLSGPRMVLVYNRERTFNKLIPLTENLDEELFNNGAIDITYRECEVAGDKIISIGQAIEHGNF